MMYVELDPGVRRVGIDSRTLLGGSPFRVVRLTGVEAHELDEALSALAVDDPSNSSGLIVWLLDAGFVHPRTRLEDEPLDARLVGLGSIDLILPCRDDATALTTLLDRLPVEKFASVIVVDDGSSPRLDANALPAPIQILRHVVPLGAGAARNTGWRSAKAPFVVFLDANVVIDDRAVDGSDVFERLVRFLDREPEVAAIAPRVRSTTKRGIGTLVDRYEAVRPSLDLGPSRATVRPRTRVPYVPTALLMVRRDALVDVDGFEDGLLQAEDVDLIWRLVAGGHNVRYEPALSVEHPPRETLVDWANQRFVYGRGNAELALRHPEGVVAVDVSPWSFVAWVLFVSGGRWRPALAVSLIGASVVRLAVELRPFVPHASQQAVSLAGGGTLHAGKGLAEALRRAWLPALVGGAVVSSRLRRFGAAIALVPPLVEWLKERPSVNPVQWIVMRGLDDAAFAAGQWRGVLESRSARVLRPRMQNLADLIVIRIDA